MIYGYARISTKTQSLERQIKNILRYNTEARIYQEAFTGTKVEGRKEFNKLMSIVKPGDTIIFDSVSRMSRNAEEGVDKYFELYDKGIELVFIKEPFINTEVYKKALENKIQLTNTKVDIILEAVNEYLREVAKEQIRLSFEQAEKEVKDLQQRTSESLQVLKSQGVELGRKKGSKIETKKGNKTKDIIREHIGKLSDAKIMKIAEVSKGTYYKYKKEIIAEIESA